MFGVGIQVRLRLCRMKLTGTIIASAAILVAKKSNRMSPAGH
jgi:hypothetical protein